MSLMSRKDIKVDVDGCIDGWTDTGIESLTHIYAEAGVSIKCIFYIVNSQGPVRQCWRKQFTGCHYYVLIECSHALQYI